MKALAQEPRRPDMRRDIQTPEQQHARVISGALRFSVIYRSKSQQGAATFPSAAQAAAQAAHYERASPGKLALVYAIDGSEESVLVPRDLWRDVLARSCALLDAGESPLRVIETVRFDVSLIEAAPRRLGASGKAKAKKNPSS